MVNDSAQLTKLKQLSARIGADPSLVQAAGGNTSIKQDGTLWVKASGTWLMHAETRDIMVPVALDPLLKAFEADHPNVENAQEFVVEALNPSALRPSIETTLHALVPHRVVVHVHCIETIALAVRQDVETILKPLLAGLNWAFVPYRKPGVQLSKAIAESMAPGTNVLILGNHGLVVAAETVEQAEELLTQTCSRLRQPSRMVQQADDVALNSAIAGRPYQVAPQAEQHGAALDPVSCGIAAGGSLYPDHVIFLGRGSVLANPGEDVEAVCDRIRAAGAAEPVSILFPGSGVVMHESASPGALALARCLADVTARIPEGAELSYLSSEQEDTLINWDAEKYRQRLNATDTAAAS